jgi:hypothetical protein
VAPSEPAATEPGDPELQDIAQSASARATTHTERKLHRFIVLGIITLAPRDRRGPSG